MCTRFAIALIMAALFACGCEFDVGTVDIKLVYTTDVDRDPLDPDYVTTLKVRIEGDDLETIEETFSNRTGEGGTISSVPVGKNRVVTVEGWQASGALFSRGQSAPFDMESGTTRLYLYISKVGFFSPPPNPNLIADGRFTDQYQVSLPAELRRVFHTATLMDRSQVLVAGGLASPDPDDFIGLFQPSEPLSGVTRFDGTVGAFIKEQESSDCVNNFLHCMRYARAFHTAALLPDGKHVMVIGGESTSGVLEAEAYDVEDRTFSLVEMKQTRTRHTSVSLIGEREGILTVGGLGREPPELLAHGELVASASTTGWDNLLGIARAGAVAVAYPDGVLVIGGWEQFNGGRVASNAIDRIEFDQGSPRVTALVPLAEARADHTAVWVPGAEGNGRAFVCGGRRNDSEMVESCEIVDPFGEHGSVQPSGQTMRRWRHTATVLQNRNVLIAGGFDNTGGTFNVALNTALLVTNIQDTGDHITMNDGRAGHTATLLPNGMVVLIGGVWVLGGVPDPVKMSEVDYEFYNPNPYE